MFILNIIISLLLNFCNPAKVDKPNEFILNSGDSLTVKEINIHGNTKTKEKIILREIVFSVNDTILKSELDSCLTKTEKDIFNTSLFLDIEIKYSINKKDEISFDIYVKERWFTFVFPILELADRSPNEWWVDHNHEIDRLEYGLKFIQHNCRGMDEDLTLQLQFGYSQKFKLEYLIPYIDKNQKTGLKINAYHENNHEIAYGINLQNKLLYLENQSIVRQRNILDFIFSRRNKIRNIHLLGLSFNNNKISDTIVGLNSNYFGSNLPSQSYFSFWYNYNSNHTDIHFYPEKGYSVDFLLRKDGLGIINDMNRITIGASISYYKNFGNRIYYAGKSMFNFSSLKDQNFYNSPVLGYHGIYPRAYEYYLVRGKAFLLVKNEMKFKLIDRDFYINKFQNLKKFNNVPLVLYPKVFVDAAYMYDNLSFKNYEMTNRMLLGAGFGFDFVTYYDIVIRCELGVNHKKETALFFHFEKAI
ncbi:MAG: POTRA domain-containing protein [Bacteroidota bacterium]|nr:POTRA domain-containing protein [Bacteroidota bacterium]